MSTRTDYALCSLCASLTKEVGEAVGPDSYPREASCRRLSAQPYRLTYVNGRREFS